MSKLHDEFLKVKRENSEDPSTLIFETEYWDTIMENIENMDFNKLSIDSYPEYSFLQVPYKTDYFVMAVNKKTPQICKFLSTRIINYTIECAQNFEDCDEVRCPPKYDKAMDELNYIINNRK